MATRRIAGYAIPGFVVFFAWLVLIVLALIGSASQLVTRKYSAGRIRREESWPSRHAL